MLDPEPTEEVFANEEPVPLDTTPVEDMEDTAVTPTLCSRKRPREVSPEHTASNDDDEEDQIHHPSPADDELDREMSPELEERVLPDHDLAEEDQGHHPSPGDDELDREMSPELEERVLPDPAPAEEEPLNPNAAPSEELLNPHAAPAEELLTTPEKENPRADISITPPPTPSPFVPRQVPRMADPDLDLTSPPPPPSPVKMRFHRSRKNGVSTYSSVDVSTYIFTFVLLLF